MNAKKSWVIIRTAIINTHYGYGKPVGMVRGEPKCYQKFNVCKYACYSCPYVTARRRQLTFSAADLNNAPDEGNQNPWCKSLYLIVLTLVPTAQFSNKSAIWYGLTTSDLNSFRV